MDELIGLTVLYLFLDGVISVFKAGEERNDSFISSLYLCRGAFALLMMLWWLYVRWAVL